MKVLSFPPSPAPVVWMAALTLLGPVAFAAQTSAPDVSPSPAPSASPAARPSEPAVVAPDAPDAPSAPEVSRDGDEDERPRRRQKRGKSDVRFGGSVEVPAGEVHEKDVVVMGGSVQVTGTAKKDVVVMGGSAEISGNVGGDTVVIGGSLELGPNAHVDGDVVVVGGSLDKAPGAHVGGETVEVGAPGAIVGALPLLSAFPGDWNIGLGLGFLSILGWLKTAVLTLLLALVITAVLPTRVEAAATVLRERWLACLGWGFVAFVVSFPLTLILCITCVGVVVPWLFYQVAKYFGLAALFVVIGHAITRNAFRREVTLLPALLVGFLVLSLIGMLAPVWIVYGWFAVGCALITKFGANRPWYREPVPPSVAPVVVPPPPPTQSEL